MAQEVEKRIRLKVLAPKSEKAFNNIIAACDFLAAQQVEITPATVGTVTAGKVGGPRVQSIRNNVDF